MALTTRKVPDVIMHALVLQNNQRLTDTIGSTYFHLDRTASTVGDVDYTNPSVSRLAVAVTDATDAATGIVLVNAIKAAVQTHFADTIAHDTATSAQITIANGTDTATAVTLANDLKAKYNVHISAANVHFNNDGDNAVTNADATDAATLVTLVNEIKGDVNLHMASAPPGVFINLVSA